MRVKVRLGRCSTCGRLGHNAVTCDSDLPPGEGWLYEEDDVHEKRGREANGYDRCVRCSALLFRDEVAKHECVRREIVQPCPLGALTNYAGES